MKIVKPSFEILTPAAEIRLMCRKIEQIGRICYKSEDRITTDSSKAFVKMLIERGHEAMVEHSGHISVKFICDRGVSHELVRHRLPSFAQESTRYCNYSQDKFNNGITFIKPVFFDYPGSAYLLWEDQCKNVEDTYLALIRKGATPQEARTVLNNSTKTEIVISTNVREWRHVFRLRTPGTAHPQMRELTIPLLKELSEIEPILFQDILKGVGPYEYGG